jgi:hypothetical protein
MPKARAANNVDPPVSLVWFADDQAVQRCFETQRGERSGNVMDLSVGDHHRAGKARAWNITDA